MKGKPKPAAIDVKRLKGLLTRANKRDLKPQDYELLEQVVDKVNALREAVSKGLSEEALERMLRSMFGKKR
jgi:hypothetical protein